LINPWPFGGTFLFDVQSFAGYIPKCFCVLIRVLICPWILLLWADP